MSKNTQHIPGKILAATEQYPPPVPTLADFYKPPDDQSLPEEESIVEQISDAAAPEYPPPVPSLADYYTPPNKTPMANFSSDGTSPPTAITESSNRPIPKSNQKKIKKKSKKSKRK